MIRYFGAIVIILVIVVVALYFMFRDIKEDNVSSPSAMTARSNPKALQSGSEAVRQLDRILTDPTLIGNSDWRKNAQEAVDTWHSK